MGDGWEISLIFVEQITEQLLNDSDRYYICLITAVFIGWRSRTFKTICYMQKC